MDFDGAERERGELVPGCNCAPCGFQKIRRVFSSGAEPTLRTVSDTPGMTAAAVLRLVLDGILHIDWWEPLRLDSRVSGTPIGRQIWPVPLGCRSQEERCH